MQEKVARRTGGVCGGEVELAFQVSAAEGDRGQRRNAQVIGFQCAEFWADALNEIGEGAFASSEYALLLADLVTCGDTVAQNLFAASRVLEFGNDGVPQWRVMFTH